jgi:hypothetical protein
MNSNDEGNGELCIAHSDSSPAFENAKGGFNKVFRSLLQNILFMPPILPLFLLGRIHAVQNMIKKARNWLKSNTGGCWNCCRNSAGAQRQKT